MAWQRAPFGRLGMGLAGPVIAGIPGWMLANFSWIREGVLAGMAFPGPEAWAELARRGVRAVLSLTESPPPGDPGREGLGALHVPIHDFSTPSDDDLRRCLDFLREHVERGEAVVVHCLAGQGRTGTVLAAFLVDEGMPATEAIRTVRSLRPGSIETRGQVGLVERHAQTVARREAGS